MDLLRFRMNHVGKMHKIRVSQCLSKSLNVESFNEGVVIKELLLDCVTTGMETLKKLF